MNNNVQAIIYTAYEAFNKRDINTVFTVMTPDVHWPNGWEGGYVEGQENVRAYWTRQWKELNYYRKIADCFYNNYWTRQWKELNPIVLPVSIKEAGDGKTVVDVHQQVKDIYGKLLFDGIIKHIYTIENGLIKSMDIEQ